MNNRILASVMVIGLVGAAAAGSTVALFSDTEASSNNTFAAGQIDLKIDWNETYNNESVETVELTDNPGPIFHLNDVKPGDSGEATISLHTYDNPAWVWMRAMQTSSQDNTCTEPESIAEGGANGTGCGTLGELGQHLNITIWYDDGDNTYEEGERVIFNNTAELLNEMSIERGVLLDGNTTNDVEVPTNDVFQNSTTKYIGFRWKVPLDAGNEIQTDSKTLDIEFYAEQSRNNPNPTNPWNPPQ